MEAAKIEHVLLDNKYILFICSVEFFFDPEISKGNLKVMPVSQVAVAPPRYYSLITCVPYPIQLVFPLLTLAVAPGPYTTIQTRNLAVELVD